MHIHPSSPNSGFSLQSEENAATRIQAGFRGYRVRKELHHQTCCTTERNRRRQQRSPRQRNDQKAMDNKSTTAELGSATASRISNASEQHRGECSSVSEGLSAEDRSAAKIQAGVRGFLVRKKQKMATDAATKIQAGFRGFMARKETQKLRQH